MSNNRDRYRSVFRPGLFSGCTVVVTGVRSGLGRCAAHELEWGQAGVRVDAVAPGWTASAGIDTDDEAYRNVLRAPPPCS